MMMMQAASSAHSQHTLMKDQLLKRVRDIPALPQVVNEVLSLLSVPGSPASRIAELISLDPGLTSRVLRMVNSSAYGMQRQITSVQQSIALLGFASVRSLVLSASVCNAFRNPSKQVKEGGLEIEEFWHHSLLTALCAKHICTLYNMKEGEEIFSAAMLHDVGHLILGYFASDLDHILTQNLHKLKIDRDSPESLGIETKLFGFDHQALGMDLAQRWNLPAPVIEVIAHHHKPKLAQKHQGAVLVVALCNQLLHARKHYGWDELDLDCLTPDVIEFFSFEEDEELEALGEQLAPFEEEARELVSFMFAMAEQEAEESP